MNPTKYPDIQILKREDQINENGELIGVTRLDKENNAIEISIPKEHRDLTDEITKKTGFQKDEIYKRWIINAIIHEDVHWVCHKLDVDCYEINNITSYIEKYR